MPSRSESIHPSVKLCHGIAPRLRPLDPANLLQLPPPIQLFDKRSRIAPARFDLDEEFQKNLGPNHLLDIKPRRRPNLLEHLPALTQQDGLLPLALAKNHGCDPRHPIAL